eukprot:gnl/Dysnectes_brevis/1866_a2144_1749.p1 GENE.gnl/Dysnectes_brevis/1866_a2144_1749~~gnl/Dysnectes_brevis/1866_a2144_1749.p1  ORF type:complete len:864 (-),score=344.28 gnl/Dysnectes_brevis/1866_a2144_1749:45-2636(-)
MFSPRFKTHFQATAQIAIRLRKRNIAPLIGEVFLAIYLLAITLLPAVLMNGSEVEKDFIFDLSPFDSCPSADIIDSCIDLVWSPSDDFNSQEIISNLLEDIEDVYGITPNTRSFTTEESMMTWLRGDGLGQASSAISVRDSTHLSTDVMIMSPTQDVTAPVLTSSTYSGSSQIVLHTLLAHASAKQQGYNINIAQIYTANTAVISADEMSTSSALAMGLIFLFSGAQLITILAKEKKELRFDLQVLAGLHRPAYILAHVVVSLIDLLVLWSITVLAGPILHIYIDYTTAFIVGIVTLVAFAAFIPYGAVCFALCKTEATTTTLYMLVGLLVSVVLPQLIVFVPWFLSHPTMLLLVAFLLPPAMPTLAAIQISAAQAGRDSFSWEIITQGPVSGVGFPSLLAISLTAAVQAVFFIVLACWIDQVLPTSMEARKEPLFFLKKKTPRARRLVTAEGEEKDYVICCQKLEKVYKTKSKRDEKKQQKIDAKKLKKEQKKRKKGGILSCMDNDEPSDAIDSPLIVKPPQGPSNKREDGVHAIDGMTLNLEGGQILGLLGHNGSGKTTTVRTLCGKVSATRGQCLVCGMDPSREQEEVAQNIAVVLQDNVIFPYTTVDEQLQHMAALYLWQKTPEHRQEMVSRSIRLMGLEDHINKTAQNLSGGLKRRLNIGQALLADARVVFLDEPSSGLDVSSRHYLWEVLAELAQDPRRLVVLTTHSMEEAEALCDRIVIMARGRVAASGTPMYLKGAFAEGYTVTVSVAEDYADGAQHMLEASLQVSTGRHLLVKDHGDHRTFNALIPFELQGTIPTALEKLEELQGQGILLSVGLSTPSLNEVFLNVAGRSSDEADQVRLLAAEDHSQLAEVTIK